MVKCGRPCKGDEQLSRDRLLDAALQLFLKQGYGKVSMETIAREAQVSLRTLYSQFDGKAGLFGALIGRCSDQFIGSLSLEQPLEEALVVFGQQFLYRITRPDVLRMRAILIGESAQFPDLATQFYDHGPRRTLGQLIAFFKHHQDAGRIANIDPSFLADQYISSLRGERLQRLQLGLETIPEVDEVNQWVIEVTHLFLKGCAQDWAGA